MEKIKEIQARLSELINHSGYSQTELSKMIGVSQQTISHYVKGNILPSLDTFAKLCEVLDADANYVLGITK